MTLQRFVLVTLGVFAAVGACGGDGDSGGTGGVSTGGTTSAGGAGNGGTGGGSGGGSGGTGGDGAAGSSGGPSGGSGGSAGGGGAPDAGPNDGSANDGSANDGSANDGSAGGDAGPPAAIGCPTSFAKEVFRDDFEGSSVDGAKWSVTNQNTGGGVFTQLTKMLAANVTVSGGRLRVASMRHCQDPYPSITAEHPALCSGTNFYSGGWVRAKQGYAAGKGLMIFHAKLPKPVQGTFPALWARNTDSGAAYGELDLIETWWDTKTKGVAGDPNVFFITTWVGSGPFNTTGNQVGPFPSVPSLFHVWEVEWDATASPAAVKYFYRDKPGATRQLLRTVTASTQGLTGKLTEAEYKAVLALPWRPYVDFAVEPGTTAWHVGPDAAASYDPEDLEVESVVVCQA